MNYERTAYSKMWFLILLLVTFVAGCASNPQEIPPVAGGAPTVTSTTPANLATGVQINRRITATFSQEMDPATISITSYYVTGPSPSTAVVPGTFAYAGETAVFTPSSALATNSLYTATVTTSVKNKAGVAMAVNHIWTFTTGLTGDATAPTLITTGAADGDVGLPINRNITATFSEPMDPSTLVNPATNYKLTEFGSTTPIPGVVTYNGNTVTLNPTNGLKPLTKYTVSISTGAKDLAGNALTPGLRPNPWSWTTAAAADVTAPKVTNTNPANLLTNVPVDKKINVTFDKAMSLATMTTANFTVTETGVVGNLPGTVAYDVQNNIATFSPQNNLKPDTSYTVTVTNGAKDLAGNALVVPSVNGLPVPNPWTFRTAATTVVNPPVPSILKSAAPFGTFGGSAGMTNMGTLTQIRGDIGTIATDTSTVTGFHDTSGDIYTETTQNIGAVNGTIYTCTVSTTGPTSAAVNAASCAIATQARLDAVDAYKALALMPSGGVLAGNLAGTTINPGVYTNSSSVKIEGGNLTLDALGDADAVFVFQIGSTLAVGGPGVAFPQSIILAGGAQAKNVFWQVGTFATINAGGGGTMVGTIIAQSGVSFSTAGNVAIVTHNGRAISLGASVTMVNTVINVPQ